MSYPNHKKRTFAASKYQPMRLGQFARKYDIRVQDIISYLEKESEEIHSNTKLSDEDESDILDFFGIEAIEEVEEIAPPIVDEPVVIEVEEEKPVEEKSAKDEDAWMEEERPVIDADEWIKEDKPVKDEDAWIEEDSPIVEKKIAKIAIKEPESPLDDIASVEGEIEFYQPEAVEIEREDVLEVTVEEEVIEEEEQVIVEAIKEEKPKPQHKEDEVIDTDRLMELLESEEASPDLEKIKLIKAAKKELSGLKVLGKVDLPEPKKKEEKEEEQVEESQPRNEKNQRPKPSEDDWEQRRVKAKLKREKNEARVANLKKEKEEKERIARNATHYKQKLGTVQPKKKKQKAKKQVPVSPKISVPVPPIQSKKSKPQKEQPKSVAGKMWKWLTNPD